MEPSTNIQAPASPPASPLRDAKVHHYTKPTKAPRFPRNPCPSAHHTLSLISSEADAQRLFGKSFSIRSPTTGELLGPFALLAYTDHWIYNYCAYVHRVISTPLFSLRERELAVLAVAGTTQAQYVKYAHGQIGASIGLHDDIVESALAGFCLTDSPHLSPREKTIYRLALEMAQNWGRVSDSTWRDVVTRDKPKARGQQGWLEQEDELWEDVEVDGRKVETDEGRLTREEVATLTQVVASGMFVSVLVNCADVEVPGEVGREP
ncbi:hypothetical protein EKO04_010482 [Ascochyta lentis]|uniref:Carboxymuconolactone decarboxylase-like domain-containing protein n=1 Tax=Ascochyta lentis TaxID=205686 RepID=A0A8H7IY22_9PLEO|nr:hypothetical protein EKO04_010482 [Ascochyta lentis]